MNDIPEQLRTINQSQTSKIEMVEKRGESATTPNQRKQLKGSGVLAGSEFRKESFDD